MIKKKVFLAGFSIMVIFALTACRSNSEQDKDIANPDTGISTTTGENVEELDFSKITKLSIWVADEEKFTENIELIQQLFDGQCKYKPLKDYENQVEGGLSFTAYNGEEIVCYITVVKGNIFGIKWKEENETLWYEVSSNPDYAEIDRQIRKENGIEVPEE